MSTEDGNNGSVSWADGFSEDTLSFVENKGWGNANSVIESYMNLEKMSGDSSEVVRLLNDESTDEQRSKFYNAAGRPEESSGYTMKMGEGGNQESFDWFKETAHSIGLSDAQASSLMTAYDERANNIHSSQEKDTAQQSELDINELKNEYGDEFDNHIASARDVVSKLGYSTEQLDNLESDMGTKTMLDLFARIGSKLGETAFKNNDANGTGGFGSTPAQAQQELDTVQNNPAFMAKYHNGEEKEVEKINNLYKLAYPG